MIFAILFLFVFSCGVFFVPNWIWLVSLTGFDLLLWLIFCKYLPKLLKMTFKFLFFATFVFLINLIFDDVISSLIVAWRLLIVFCFVAVFSKIFTPTMLATGFSQLLFPLKIFKVDTEALSLSIVIAISFLPILSASAASLSKSLKARGFRFNIKTAFSEGHIILMAFFSELFKRVDTIELSFRARGYSGDTKK